MNMTPTEKCSSESFSDSEALADSDPISFKKSIHGLADAPRDVGWLLLSAGIIGEILPGVIGTPFWVIGTLILWPNLGKRTEYWLESRAPTLFKAGMRQVSRFLDDLDRRYPHSGVHN